ncbi:MAG: hypothetical protein AMXMBFR33_50350 [Candidatus Xenobia bacterium]
MLVRLALVLLVSFSVFCIELNLYHTLVFQFSHVQGLLGISVTLVGLALGACLAVSRPSSRPDRATVVALWLQGAGLIAVPWLLTMAVPVPLLLALLSLPLAPAGFLLSRLFQGPQVSQLYAADLVGAALAAVSFGFWLPRLGQEGSFLAIGCLVLGLAPLLPWWRGLSLVLLGAAVGLCLTLGPGLNFARSLASRPQEFPGKVFNKIPGSLARREVLHSRADVVQRLDITPDEGFLNTWYDGYAVDIIRDNDGYPMDRRLGGGLGKKSPRMLIIGTAGQGVLKPAKLLTGDPKLITGLEINRAVVDLMTGPLREYSRDPYRDVPLLMVDGRTYLASTQERFDIITLLNTFTVRNISQAVVPNYLHSEEGLAAGLARLTDNGYLSLEERNPDGRSQAAIDRFLATVISALRRCGVSDPARHLAIYEWYGSEDSAASRNRDDFFVQILAKRTPFTPEEIQFLRWYEKQPREIPLNSDHPFKGLPHIQLVYLPDQSLQGRYARLVNSRLIAQRTATDDRPYLLGARERAEVQRQLIRHSSLLCAFLLVPLVLLVRAGQAGREALAVSLAGFASGLLQAVLVGRMQLWLGTPGLALPVVVGGLLVLSGAGSFFLSPRARAKLGLALGILAGYFALWWIWVHGLQMVAGWSLTGRVLATLAALAPLALVSGYILPRATRELDLTESPGLASLLFALGSAAAAVAVPVALVLSIQQGMGLVYWLSSAVSLASVLALRR